MTREGHTGMGCAALHAAVPTLTSAHHAHPRKFQQIAAGGVPSCDGKAGRLGMLQLLRSHILHCTVSLRSNVRDKPSLVPGSPAEE